MGDTKRDREETGWTSGRVKESADGLGRRTPSENETEQEQRAAAQMREHARHRDEKEARRGRV